MVNYCCVPQCNGTGGFLFPEEKKLRKLWQVAVRRVSYKKGCGNHQCIQLFAKNILKVQTLWKQQFVAMSE